MTPSLQKMTVPGAYGARIVPVTLSLSGKNAPKRLTRTHTQQAHQQGNTIQVLRFGRRSMRRGARQLPFEVAGKFRGQPGSEVTDQSLPGDLRQHSPQAVADRKLDTRCRALFDRYQMIADLALRGRPAALVAARSDDPTRQIFAVALDTCGTVKIRGDRAELDADHAFHPFRRRHGDERRAGKAGGNLCDIAEHVENPFGRISDREMILKNLHGCEVRNGDRAAVFGAQFGFCRWYLCDV